MEPANIDWKNIESIFILDDLYENINAPKWIDFSAPDHVSIDDEAWFCKPDCHHPKTAEDFLRSTFSSKVKHLRSVSLFENRHLRDGNMRRLNKSKTLKSPSRVQDDQENENPNFSTPLEKRKPPLDKSPLGLPKQDRKPPKLKSTLSASNLFAGKEIFNHITEFCSELKKMVMKTKDVENSKKMNDQKKKLLDECLVENSENLKCLERENIVNTPTKPLLEVMEKGKSKVVETCSNEKKPRRLKRDEKENNRIAVDLNIVGKGQKEQQHLLQVRTNPPSPQCFSGYREPLRRAKPTTPLKLSKSIQAEKCVLQEMRQNNKLEKEEQPLACRDKVSSQSISVAKEETRAMEMFWILKPCLAK